MVNLHTPPNKVGAQLNAKGGIHGTALNAAFFRGEVETTLALHQNGANSNALDAVGESSLYRAAESGHHAIAKLLLEHQADVNIQTGCDRESPLHVVASAGGLYVCRLLLKHVADVASKNINRQAPLHLASRRGHADIV